MEDLFDYLSDLATLLMKIAIWIGSGGRFGVQHHYRQPASLLLKALLTSSNPLHACNLDLEVNRERTPAKESWARKHHTESTIRLLHALGSRVFTRRSVYRKRCGRKEETTLCISISREAPRGCVCTRQRAISRIRHRKHYLHFLVARHLD